GMVSRTASNAEHLSMDSMSTWSGEKLHLSCSPEELFPVLESLWGSSQQPSA
ncbi:hypothetical protein NPIL_257441, partial [Nephila pilipes]